MLVKPSVLKFCLLLIVSVLAFSLLLNTLNTGTPITGFAVDEAAADNPDDGAGEPLPGEEGSHPGFAECQSLPEGTAMEMIYNCEEAGYEHCEDVVGNVFKFTAENELFEEGVCVLELPPDEVGYEGNAYVRDWITCADPKAVTLARYENDAWVPVSLEHTTVAIEGEGVTVSATVNKLGSYAVIKQTSYYIPPEKEGRVATCNQFSCTPLNELQDLSDATNYIAKTTTAGYTNPENKQILAGQNIRLNVCGMINGCVALNEGIENRSCTPGIDPEISNRIGLSCTPNGGDCCIPATDGICDPDCWIKPVLVNDMPLTAVDENGATINVAEDSTDRDCLEQGEKDALKDIQHSLHELEPELINSFRFDVGEKKWQLIEHNFEYPVVVSGDITFTVQSESDPSYVWFKDFMYIDINGNEHRLYPQWQLGKDWLTAVEDGVQHKFCQECSSELDDEGENRPIEGYGPEQRQGLNEDYEQIRRFDDDGDDMNTDRSYWDYLFFHPYVWYQNKGYTRNVFTIPNLTIKGIKYEATKDETEPIVSVIVGLDYYDVDSDLDNDGFGAETDCRDNNPAIKPAKREPIGCDGVDNNCNKELFFTNDEENAFEYDIPVVWNGKMDDNEFWNNQHILAPCNGYIQILDSRGIAYLELWKNEKFITTTAEDELAYSINTQIFPGIPNINIDSLVDINLEGQQAIRGNFFLKQNLWNGTLWTNYQKIFRSYEDTNLEIESWEGGPPSACGDPDDVNDVRYCIVGAKDSCDINPETAIDCGGARTGTGAWDRDGTDLEAIFSGWQIHPNYEKPEVKIKEGDVIWGAVLPDTDDDIFQDGEADGYLKFQVWCYPKISPTEEEKRLYIDEDLNCETEQQEQKTAYFCKSDMFDWDNRRCYQGNQLCSFSTTTYGGGCEYTTKAEEIGILDYHVFVCPENTEEPCYKYFEDNFKVCSEKESCNPATNLDLDCDGLKPYATRDDGTADTSKPLDSECVGTCAPDTCNPVEKKWCNLGQWDENNYCQKCGSQDSSCGKACTEGERSCQGGCFAGTCDVSDNKWCNDGYWDTTDYATKCGKNDSEFYSQANNECTHRACDVAADKICFQSVSNWLWGNGEIGRIYNDTTCNLVDSSCDKTCTSGTCDVHSEKYCDSNGDWIQSENYCDLCGAFDADCGVDVCQEGVCDYGSHKVCINKKWTQPADYCATCSQSEMTTGYCACTMTLGQEEKETSCTDNIDNDCDGVKDCADPDCPSDLPECSCIEDRTQSCGATQGLCLAGTQTCSNGAWGACIGEVKPKTETCNSFDDDCDGNTDEGCGSCLAGETRICGADRGLCNGGLQACAETTGLWSTCSGPVYRTVTQEKCDGQDNNCDGKIDEGCGCVEGSNQTCGANVGICKAGTQTCTQGKWGDCAGMKDKLPEVCNDGLDNDCDGLIDNADDSCQASGSLSPTCYDAIQNQGEEETDCGGPCEDCDRTTCNDRQKNGDEEGMDCGGKCPPCNGEVVQTEECGNDVCEDNEDSDSCPEDCPAAATKITKSETPGFPFTTVLISIIALGIVAILAMAFMKSKKTGQPIGDVIKGMFTKKQSFRPAQKPSEKTYTAQQKPSFQLPSQPARTQKRKSLEEEQLEKSFKEASDIFKK